MRVLITIDEYNSRSGAESFMRDLANGLKKHGHSVMVFSNHPGLAGGMPDREGITLATDLENLPFQPDIIHAQHHLDAMTAITALPGVPAVYHCHGAIWQDCPLKHPRVYRYLAMSRTLAERMKVESNIPSSNVDVLLNGVDLERFSMVRDLPPKAARALFFNSRHASDSPTLVAVREAATRRGLTLDVLGRSFENFIEAPEKLLPSYDIVFASGISAIEAMACGCAVVILGISSCGPMVRPENFDRLRQVNFSIAANSAPPFVDQIESELASFSAERSRRVSHQLRREADFKLVIRKLESLYEQVIERHLHLRPEIHDEIRALSRFLRKIAPLIKMCEETTLMETSMSFPVNSKQPISR